MAVPAVHDFNFDEIIMPDNSVVNSTPMNAPKNYKRRVISLEACEKLQFQKYPYIQHHGVVLITDPAPPYALKRVSHHSVHSCLWPRIILTILSPFFPHSPHCLTLASSSLFVAYLLLYGFV
jgi:hypothetical protein